MPIPTDFTDNGWVELDRYGRFIVYEDPSGARPLARLNTVSGVSRRHRNENLRTLEVMAVLRSIARAATQPGQERDGLIQSIRNLAGELDEQVDPT